jgi:hypothetical protein
LSGQKKELALVIEFFPCDLLVLLQSDKGQQLTLRKRVKFMFSIADGMKYEAGKD